MKRSSEPRRAARSIDKARASRLSGPAAARAELTAALRACRGAFLGVGLMTAALNVLYLTSSFFMLEVYDRVIPSRSIPTLVGLLILAAILFLFQGCLDILRGRVLVRIGASLDRSLRLRVYDTLVRLPLFGQAPGGAMQPLRDLDQVRGFLSGLGPTALFDLPWLPLYLGICFAFHPLIGLTALVGGLILLYLTLTTEMMSRRPTRAAMEAGSMRQSMAEQARRNAEVVQALGMSRQLAGHWDDVNARYLSSHRRASDIVAGIGSISKVLRIALQSAVLAVGAYLVLQQQATAGIIIAASILTSRALSPIELAIANWKGFVGSRQAWRRLRDLLAIIPERHEAMQLPPPKLSLAVEAASAIPPGGRIAVVQDATFSLKAGQGLGVVGPSGSGKSSLARLLVGVWRPVRGGVRLDGATFDQWSSEALGPHIGYLPQDIELFAGSIAENISRFADDPDAEVVIRAAKAAGVHDTILRFTAGYETQIGESGINISGGQRQGIALARALYGDPFLVVLDEPNSNLDFIGENALTAAILEVRARGGIVVIIAHRPSALAGVDTMLVMQEGKVQAFGPKEEILGRLLPAAQAAGRPPPQVVSGGKSGGEPKAGLMVVGGGAERS